jgi:hypothetical protein
MRSRFDAFIYARQRGIVVAICAYAALRIVLFSAASPLFNPIDEQFHFDAIRKFSRGYKSSPGLPPVDPESARLFALYGSPEYLTPADALRTVHLDQPIAGMPSPLREQKYQHWFAYWSERKNFEIHAPPLYYSIGSLWFRLGGILGLAGWPLAYWLRFLNALGYAALVWLAFSFVREVYPERRFLGLAVPALLAVFPQDVFLGINREVLSAPLAALSLLLLFCSLRNRRFSHLYVLAGSLCIGLMFLTDVSNAVFFLALAGILAFRVWNAAPGQARTMESGWALLGTLIAAALPALWMMHNYLVFGDLTASREKIAALGWTVKPLSQIWSHPLFSWHGCAYFLDGLMKTYWRGEFLWHGQPMGLLATDRFFVFSSYLLIGVFVAYSLIRRPSPQPSQRLNDRLVILLLTASFLFLAGLSLQFDFGRCFYPSRAFPYFISGRIISGTLLPFAIIYMSGFEILLSRLRRWIPLEFALIALLLVVTISDFQTKAVLFHSAFNFFALWGHVPVIAP